MPRLFLPVWCVVLRLLSKRPAYLLEHVLDRAQFRLLYLALARLSLVAQFVDLVLKHHHNLSHIIVMLLSVKERLARLGLY